MKTIAVEWGKGCPQGKVEVSHGRLSSVVMVSGDGKVDGDLFTFNHGPCCLEITVDEENLSAGADPTFITFRTEDNPFTVLLRDVSREYPIWIPAYHVVVTTPDDLRSYDEIADAIRSKHLQTALQRMATESEETYEDAAAATRPLICPTWLGLSRDMRIFSVNQDTFGYCWFHINPQFHGMPVTLSETNGAGIRYNAYFGRGMGCVNDVSRQLDGGILPILHTTVVDDDITYEAVSFASLESTSLTVDTLRGTHFLVADGHGVGHMFTDEQKQQYDELNDGEEHRDEETVLYTRVEAVNTAAVPRYAWFKAPTPEKINGAWGDNIALKGYSAKGFGTFETDRVYAVVSLNDEPLPKEELAVLLNPGETATFEFKIPHQPISQERAVTLAQQDFNARLDECRTFWRAKLASSAQLKLPEQRIQEMTRAGLLHLDIVAYGLEPEEPVAATIGVYNPIGSESSPIIQFIDSMGWHALARRALTYFLEKQHDDGFIQNFGGYMLETGPALWSMGEHYRYTRDDAWVKLIEPKLLKSCEFLMKWRERNLKEELRGNGYGLMEGKVADPEDPFRTFMLNGYAYLGMSRVAEMLTSIDSPEAGRIARDAEAFKADIRTALMENMAKSPVLPLGDGSWCPSAGPWAEACGPVGLLTDKYNWFTHGTFLARDSMIGPIYLLISEVLEPSEQAAEWIMQYHTDLWHMRNMAFSQPYYSVHPRFNLLRGEVEAFLKTYYNGFAGLADRETYTFWEHYFGASQHKTHEEGWFLMQTRWMLYLEQDTTLKLLPGIPRAWMEQGKVLELENIASYFGPVTLKVKSQVEQGRIVATVICDSACKPETVELRLPHPLKRHATSVSGGEYDAARESVIISNFTGRAEVVVEFGKLSLGVRSA
ncbi:MAG: hypothetical protein ACYDBB_02070 [Armatimonadota bacterium]